MKLSAVCYCPHLSQRGERERGRGLQTKHSPFPGNNYSQGLKGNRSTAELQFSHFEADFCEESCLIP